MFQKIINNTVAKSIELATIYTQSYSKYFRKNEQIKPSWTRREHFDTRFCIIFKLWCEIFFCEGETGHLTIPKTYFGFPLYFLSSYDSNFYGIWQLVRQLVYKVFYIRYQFPFYLMWMNLVLNLTKIPKYYEQNCRYLMYCKFG